jgi:PAS domain S-box-containing protein
MGRWSADPAAALVVIAAGAGLFAVLLAILAVMGQRRAVRRLAAEIRGLARHPLVGDLPVEGDPPIRALAAEFNRLLETVRGRGAARAAAGGPDRRLGGPPDLAFIGLDGDWRVTAFSRGAVRLTGWEAVEILDRHVEALFAPGEWERILPKLARRTLRESGLNDRVRLLRRDGVAWPAQVSIASPLDEGSGDATILVARDVTEETDLERRLREGEARYRQVAEGLGDGVLIVQEGQVVYANPALARLVGRGPGSLAGLPFKDLLQARDLLRVVDLLRHAEAGEGSGGEFSCLLQGEGGVPVQVRLAWTSGEYQGRRALLATVSDIGARARFEQALRQSEARLQATLASSGDGILVLAPGPRGPEVALANPAFAAIFGAADPSLVGLTAVGLAERLRGAAARPEEVEGWIREAATGSESAREGLELAAPRPAFVDLRAGPVRSAAGETCGTILTVRDVTAREEGARHLRHDLDESARIRREIETANRQLAETQKTLADRNARLEALNTELKSLDEMKSSLLANVSHELHTPLVSIKGYTEMIVKRKLGPLTPEQDRGLGVALKNIDRLIELIDNLLSFSRMEKGETQLHLENVPLWTLVDEAIELVGERVRRRNLTVTTQYETDDLTVRCDRVKIGQVLTNLMTNAVKFNRDGGRITLTARRGQQGFLELDVADSGIGIPPESRERIFERFYQVDGSPRRRYEGAGIGLSIVRDILRLHGCTIRVASEVGKGSVFTVTLPMARDQEGAPTRPGPAPAPRQRERPEPG